MDEKIKIYSKDIKIRKKWPDSFDPSEKVEKVKVDYKRSNLKREIQDALDEMQEDLENDF